MSSKATLSATFELTVPKAMRDALGWRPGVELALIPKGRGVLVLPVPDAHELRGIARGANPDHYRDLTDRA